MKLTIKTEIPEKDFMEGLLNMRHSELDVMLQLSFYALVNKWNYNKLIYYLNLLEIK